MQPSGIALGTYQSTTSKAYHGNTVMRGWCLYILYGTIVVSAGQRGQRRSAASKLSTVLTM